MNPLCRHVERARGAARRFLAVLSTGRACRRCAANVTLHSPRTLSRQGAKLSGSFKCSIREAGFRSMGSSPHRAPKRPITPDAASTQRRPHSPRATSPLLSRPEAAAGAFTASTPSPTPLHKRLSADRSPVGAAFGLASQTSAITIAIAIEVEHVEQIANRRHVGWNIRIVIVHPRIGQVVTTAVGEFAEMPVALNEFYE